MSFVLQILPLEGCLKVGARSRWMQVNENMTPWHGLHDFAEKGVYSMQNPRAYLESRKRGYCSLEDIPKTINCLESRP